MTEDKIFEGIINGTFDTHRIHDAVSMMRDCISEHDGDEIQKVFDAGEGWLFLVGPTPLSDDEPLFDCFVYSLIKGALLPDIVSDSDDLLTHELPEVPIPDLA